MAYFHCLIGGGSGGGYELTVTCDADFAGTTITCTDGVTTLTQTCPSASPYEVVFEIPNGGDWTISGVVGGQTVSTGVNIPTSAELIATVQQTVTIYSAKEDTISYTDIDGATQTITFASGATSKQVQITINPNGSSITFTSSVAKNPNNLSQDYSKTFTITASTTDIYLMPDAVKTLYWWGYESSDLEDCTSANGWTAETGFTLVSPTHSTAYISIAPSVTKNESAIGSDTKISGNLKAIATGVSAINSNYGMFATYSGKNISSSSNRLAVTYFDSANIKLYTLTSATSGYAIILGYKDGSYTQSNKVHALWYE